LINSGFWFTSFESPHIHHRLAAKPRQRTPDTLRAGAALALALCRGCCRGRSGLCRQAVGGGGGNSRPPAAGTTSAVLEHTSVHDGGARGCCQRRKVARPMRKPWLLVAGKQDHHHWLYTGSTLASSRPPTTNHGTMAGGRKGRAFAPFAMACRHRRARLDKASVSGAWRPKTCARQCARPELGA
jgi:hypothetical protein